MICVFGITWHCYLLSGWGLFNVTRFSLSTLSLRHYFNFNLSFLLTLGSLYYGQSSYHRCPWIKLKLDVDFKKAITYFVANVGVCSIDELILCFAPLLSESRDLSFIKLLLKFKRSLAWRILRFPMFFNMVDGMAFRQINIGVAFWSHRDILLWGFHLFRLSAHWTHLSSISCFNYKQSIIKYNRKYFFIQQKLSESVLSDTHWKNSSL